nr:AsmA family protein [Pedobacter sp. ASV19]
MPRWTKILLKTLGVIVALIVVIFTALGFYVNSHKKELLSSITKKLNENLNGTLTVGDMDPTFFNGFPGISLTLKNVVMKDQQWNVHKHTLLDAKRFNVTVNVMALLKGTIEIKKVSINDAAVYLYTDSTGYSNTSIFKKKKKEEPKKDNKESSTEIRKFTLDRVSFVLDNQKGSKLFQFEVNDLDGNMEYPDSGWNASLKLKTLVKSLAFNTQKGSFIKDRLLDCLLYTSDAADER